MPFAERRVIASAVVKRHGQDLFQIRSGLRVPMLRSRDLKILQSRNFIKGLYSML